MALGVISDELQQLGAQEKQHNRTRASFFNLVVYTQKSTRDLTYSSMIESSLSKFPCRVILITHLGSEERLNIHTSTKEVGKDFFCEMIEIEVGGSFIERTPYLILPHLITDLPLHLLWTVDPSSENVVLPTLLPHANKVLVNPLTPLNLEKFCQNILASTSCPVADLNWTALRNLRKIVARTFDAPDRLERLKTAHHIHITYAKNAYRNSPLRALYFLSWLSVSLGKQIPHTIVGIDSTLPPGILLSIEIECTLKKTVICFKRNPDSRQIFIHYSDQDQCQLPACAYLPGLKEGQEVVEEIFYGTSDATYRAVLEHMKRLKV